MSAAAAPAPTAGELEAAIREALEGSALENITQRSLRATLEERFGQDLTEQKGAIKEITIRVLSEREAGEEEEEEEEDDEEGSSSGSDSSDEEEAADVESMPKAKRKGGGGFNKEYAWSEDMADFLGQGYASRAQVTKALWAYIKEHDLQNPNDKRQILCDATLERLFGCKTVGMFKMAKYLNSHLREDERVKAEVPDDEEGEEDEDEPVAKGKGSKKAKGKGKGKAAGGGGGGTGGGLQKELLWSEDMAAFLGTDRMSRAQVTKALWAYIKEHDLQNPNDKRQILCDAMFERLFGCKSVGMFQMAKHLNKHLPGAAEVKDEDDGSDSGGAGGGGGGGGKRKAAGKEKPKPKKKKAKKAGGKDGEEGGEGKKRSFPTEKLSDELAAVVGKPEAPRNEVVKELWAYIKERKLQDPNDGRQINCDATLTQLFGGMERVSGFAMNKYLGPHFLGRV